LEIYLKKRKSKKKITSPKKEKEGSSPKVKPRELTSPRKYHRENNSSETSKLSRDQETPRKIIRGNENESEKKNPVKIGRQNIRICRGVIFCKKKSHNFPRKNFFANF